MGTQRTREASDNFAATGFVASAAMTEIGRSLGSNTPEYTASLSEKLAAGPGFDQMRSYHALLLSVAAVYGAAFYGLYLLEGTSLGSIFGLIFTIVGSVVAFGTAIALAFQFGPYSSLKFRTRFFPVDKPDPNAGRSWTGSVLGDLFLVTPFKLLVFLLLAPFLLLGMATEILRFILLSMANKKHISYRGDQGKYYDRVRKEYADHYHQNGVAAANEYLRIAYSGLLTPIGTLIPSNEWHHGKYKNWLAPMIERHGPVDKYCTGKAGSASVDPSDRTDVVSGARMELKPGEVVDTREYAKVPDKYSAI